MLPAAVSLAGLDARLVSEVGWSRQSWRHGSFELDVVAFYHETHKDGQVSIMKHLTFAGGYLFFSCWTVAQGCNDLTSILVVEHAGCTLSGGFGERPFFSCLRLEMVCDQQGIRVVVTAGLPNANARRTKHILSSTISQPC